jgi:hypothetical protein
MLQFMRVWALTRAMSGRFTAGSLVLALTFILRFELGFGAAVQSQDTGLAASLRQHQFALELSEGRLRGAAAT